MAGIIWHDRVDSTNSLALRQISTLDNLSVLAAREQTAGRGQRGNRWLSRPGENLTFSLVLRFGEGGFPPLAAKQACRINILAPVAVRDFLREDGCDCRIKWPNDVFAGGKKICGILVENGLGGGKIVHSVIGIGINMNQRVFDDLANATSLSCMTGKQYDLHASLEKVVAKLEAWLPALRDGDAYAALRREYDAALFLKGVVRQYRNLLTNNLFSGIIEGVDEEGRAVVTNCDDGSLQRFSFKELGYIL